MVAPSRRNGGWTRLTRAAAIAIVNEYGSAWMAEDEERICRIFSEDALYLEHPYDRTRIYEGRTAIRNYWIEHVQGKQRNIRFSQVEGALLLDAERSTVLAKWECTFENVQGNGLDYKTVEFVQVAMLHFDSAGLIDCLEEYWTSRGQFGKGEQGLTKRQAVKLAKRKPAGRGSKARLAARVPAQKMWLGSYAMR